MSAETTSEGGLCLEHLVSVDFSILKGTLESIVCRLRDQDDKIETLTSDLEASRLETHALRQRIADTVALGGGGAANRPPSRPPAVLPPIQTPRTSSGATQSSESTDLTDEILDELRKTQDEVHELRRRVASAFAEVRRGGSATAAPAGGDGTEVARVQDELHELRKRVAEALGNVAPKSLEEEVRRTQEEIHELRKRVAATVSVGGDGGGAGVNRLDALEQDLRKTQDEVHSLRVRTAQSFAKAREGGAAGESEPAGDEQRYTPEQVDAAKVWLKLTDAAAPEPAAVRVASSSGGASRQQKEQQQATTGTPRTRDVSNRVQATEDELGQLGQSLRELSRVSDSKMEVRRLQDMLGVVQRQNRALGVAVGTETSERLDSMTKDLASQVADLRTDIQMLARSSGNKRSNGSSSSPAPAGLGINGTSALSSTSKSPASTGMAARTRTPQR